MAVPPVRFTLDLSRLDAVTKDLLVRAYASNESIVNAIRTGEYHYEDPNDIVAKTFKGALNKEVVVRAENLSGTLSKNYTGVGNLNEYIKFRISSYPTDWDELNRIGKFLLLNNTVNTDDLLNWSRYFVNLMVDQITPGEEGQDPVVTFMGNIDVYQNTEVRELARPVQPIGYNNQFQPETAFFAQALPDIATLTDEKARFFYPVIFFFALRSRLGVPGANYRNRLSKIGNFVEIYGQGHITFILPENHHFKTLMTENDGPNTAQNPIDKDILAKLIKLRTGIETQNIGRIAYGIIIQNCTFFGLSHYVSYERLLAKIGTSQSANLLGAITTNAKIDQTIKFIQLLSMATSFPDDNVWYCIRAVDGSFMHDWTPRMLNWITLNIAYLVQSLIPDVDNNPYSNLLALDKNTFKRFDAARERHLDAWINYWKANSSSENDGSLDPPNLPEREEAGQMDADPDILEAFDMM